MPRNTASNWSREYDPDAPVSIRHTVNLQQRFFQLRSEQLETLRKHAPLTHDALTRDYDCDAVVAHHRIGQIAEIECVTLANQAREHGEQFSAGGRESLQILGDLVTACELSVKGQDEIDRIARGELTPQFHNGQFSLVGPTAGDAGNRWRDVNGNPVVVLSPKDRWPQNERSNVSVGELMRGMLVPSRDAAVRNSLAEGADATGGVTVPQIVLPQWIDRLRAATVTIAAGARTVRLDTQVTSMARLASDPTASWRNENAAITDADPSFEKVTFTARSLYALVKVSLELLQDSVNITEILEAALTRALALELDRVALFGSGTAPEPRGVFNTTGIQTVSMGTNGAVPVDYDDVVDLLLALANANAKKPTALIAAPRTTHTYAKLKDTTSQPLVAPRIVSDIPMLETTTVPVNQAVGTSNDCSSVIAGYFPELMIGLRQELRLQLLKEAYMGNMQIGFLAHLRADVQLEHPASFGRLIGVRP